MSITALFWKQWWFKGKKEYIILGEAVMQLLCLLLWINLGLNSSSSQKVSNLENRLGQNAALRRRRRLQDPDMWRRLRQDWLRKPSSNVDRNHQHLITMETKMLLEKLQNKTKRRQERQMEKQGAVKDTPKKAETKEASASEEEKSEEKKEGEQGEKEEKGDEGKKEKKDSKEEVKTKEDRNSLGNRGSQNRRRGGAGASGGGGSGGGRYQREVQGR